MSSSGWARVRLEELTVKVGSGATPKGGENSYEKTGTPLVRSMNVVFFKSKNILTVNKLLLFIFERARSVMSTIFISISLSSLAGIS